MRLSDVVSGADLSTWPQIALVIFFAAFVAIVVYLFLVRRKGSFEEQRNLPLEGDPKEPDPGDRTERGS